MRERFAKLLSHSGESRNPEFAATKTFWIPAKAGMTVVYRGLVINARMSKNIPSILPQVRLWRIHPCKTGLPG